MVSEISFRNYKLFKNKQTLQLRPITILIGKNNTGKSTITKLPTLIAGSLNGNFSAPINLENGGVRVGLSYEDLFYNREIIGDMSFGMKNKNEELEVFISGDRRYNINISRYTLNNLELGGRGSGKGVRVSQVKVGEVQMAPSFGTLGSVQLVAHGG